MRLLVTGGCGFIGSNLVRLLPPAAAEVVNLDTMTYAANLENVAEVADDRATRSSRVTSPTPRSSGGDEGRHARRQLRGREPRRPLHPRRRPTSSTPTCSAPTCCCEAARAAGVERFLQVSTDEVYGSHRPSAPSRGAPARAAQPVLGQQGRRRPAGARLHAHVRPAGDHHARLEHLRPVPVSGEADPAVRHERARRPEAARLRRRLADARLDPRRATTANGIWRALLDGTPGEVYNIGGGNERTNMWITEQHPRADRRATSAHHATSRPPRPRRALLARHLQAQRELGWKPEIAFDEGLAQTVPWYKERRDWWEPIKSGEYREFYEQQYGVR